MDKKAKIVNENLEKCENSLSKAYLHGSIPKKVLRNACRGYANEIFGKKVLQEDVIGLIDTSVKGYGKTGMLLTEEGVFYKSFGENAGCCPSWQPLTPEWVCWMFPKINWIKQWKPLIN